MRFFNLVPQFENVCQTVTKTFGKRRAEFFLTPTRARFSLTLPLFLATS
jgi:hypothetical protein